MDSVSNPNALNSFDFDVLKVATLYVTCVFIVCEVLRYICIGFYEQSILKSTDYISIFFINAISFFSVHNIKWGIASPFTQFEDIVFNRKKTGFLGPICNLAGQFVGAFLAAGMTIISWEVLSQQTWITHIATMHSELLERPWCSWKSEDFPRFLFAFVSQIVIAASMRMILTKLNTKFTPAIYTFYYTFARVLIGFPGFDVMYSFSHLAVCSLKTDEILGLFLSYMVAPVVGWLCCRFLLDSPITASQLKKEKKRERQEREAELLAEKTEQEARRKAGKQGKKRD
ncbi:hypothetical protein GCK72_004769 [Caenorhabditis remanei]|uniref:Uncharacterized protein n=1 Tax=Caenorhabditis remanei TaxID=31234 RepID=A0A6A5HCS4_CAERE|nr:hypothetical protein GCK72_004764 [Caenorhabditis remanei]XP_053589079.1 hypothetical protein GCK72_004769 [Caenorhabditis remanei]KAF1764814.1 hypothetical protein GCK72_004764 [Caenorhabditis remanei]KAF1764819.1 hypothetical protein GCK72_004769 [Caenorhabditis remanei]